ncbi:helix-turn-helix domain-containing protein [Nocardia pseudobrasiliensis]|uniref:AraC family transcriptional regulator n=1 Tax=Nocardia pseudobrasiliensis TaxID=45979 RepID=A0A370HLN1_9NOCA|nr:helix-turn-helix domain-containing protein [Nocardia pseudobrasiliensis]RDI58961.1 AraC family transcriptional regulator [Nocardia pseudobrasiliensis]
MIVVDTNHIDPNDRAEMVASAIQNTTAPAYMEHNPADGEISAWLDVTDFGPLFLARVRISGFRLVRTPTQIRRLPSALLSVSVQDTAPARLTREQDQQLISPNQLYTMDFDAPYDVDWSDGGSAAALYVTTDQLDLPTRIVRRALAVPPQSSPLCPLLASHIRSMSTATEALRADPGALDLGHASVDLIRAFLISLTDEARTDATAIPAQLLLDRIRDHIRAHLTDPALRAETIARAHHISTRYLYKLWARTGSDLEQWIIEQRLERARAQLTADPQRPIAAIALDCGFRDPSHFTRRFRTAYGMTPRDWRATPPKT